MKILLAWLLLAVLSMITIAAIAKRNRRWWRCAWCGIWFSDIGETRFQPPPGECVESASHGICPDCFNAQTGKIASERIVAA